MERNDTLVFTAQVDGRRLAAGEYALDFETIMRDGEGRKLAPQASRFYFEMRANSPKTQPEEARRRVTRAILAGDYDAAERLIAQMLKVYRRRFAAYASRGHVH